MRMREQFCEQSWRYIGEVKLQKILLVKVLAIVNLLVPAPVENSENFEKQKSTKLAADKQFMKLMSKIFNMSSNI